MTAQRLLIYVVAAVAAASAGIALRYNEQARQMAEAQALVARGTVGAPAPELRLPDLAGRMHTLDAYRGRVVLVNFWATWCPPCLREIPSFEKIRQRYLGRGFEVLGVAVDDTDAVRRFVREHGVTYPQLLAGARGTALMARFGNRHGALPYSLLVDQQGIVRLAHAGELRPETLTEHLQALLEAAPGGPPP